MDPTVSVIIPCFNAARYVAQAIRSALDQTYPEVEVIVIDDGSTDDSAKAIKEFGNKIVFIQTRNRGACAARNRGVMEATGEFVQFLDADDFLHQDKILEMIPVATRSSNCIVFSDGVRVDTERGVYFNPVKAPVEGKDPVVYVSENRGLQTPAPLHRRADLLAIGGFREELPCCQELDLHMRMVCAGASLLRIPKVLYYVRRLPASLSSDPLRIYFYCLDVVQRAEEDLRLRRQLTDDRAAALARMLAIGARRFARAGKFNQSWRFANAAKKLHSSGGFDGAFSGRSRQIVPYLGLHLTELLTIFDDALRHWFATGSGARHSSVVYCDSDGEPL